MGALCGGCPYRFRVHMDVGTMDSGHQVRTYVQYASDRHQAVSGVVQLDLYLGEFAIGGAKEFFENTFPVHSGNQRVGPVHVGGSYDVTSDHLKIDMQGKMPTSTGTLNATTTVLPLSTPEQTDFFTRNRTAWFGKNAHGNLTQLEVDGYFRENFSALDVAQLDTNIPEALGLVRVRGVQASAFYAGGFDAIYYSPIVVR